MTDKMLALADALPSVVPLITGPWLGAPDLGSQLPVLGGWALAALIATGRPARRATA